ncbi:MAG: mechanosensitive ion channel domain-containing protein [Myxococcota bacterium]|nr:mechanosensitive ion channel domain-containing protein [Myxococcota bacterium]
MILILTQQAIANTATESWFQLPYWPVTSTIPWLLLAFVLLQFSFRLQTLHKYRNWIQPLILLSVLLGLVSSMSEVSQQWFALALLIGIGFSFHTLVQDAYASLLILVEHRVVLGAWIELEGYAGRVQHRSWRCVTLKDGREQTMIVPNRFFLSHTLKVTPPGHFSTKIRCWIPQGITLLEVEARVVAWLPSAPWVADFYGLYPDSNNPRLILIELSLLRAEDKNKVLRALRTIIEEQ